MTLGGITLGEKPSDEKTSGRKTTGKKSSGTKPSGKESSGRKSSDDNSSDNRSPENNSYGEESSAGNSGLMKPLEGKTVVITRSAEEASSSSKYFEEFGAEVVSVPAVAIAACEDYSEFDEALRQNPDIIVFTSANSVLYFCKRTAEAGIDTRQAQIAAVGQRTAEACTSAGIRVDVCPEEFSAAGLLAVLKDKDLRGKAVFIPSSEIARDELSEGLRKAGANVRKVTAYRVVCPAGPEVEQGRNLISKRKPDVCVFASPSAYRNFLQIMSIRDPGEWFLGAAVAAIGPVTRSAIESSGVKVAIMPERYTMKDAAEATAKYYQNIKSDQ